MKDIDRHEDLGLLESCGAVSVSLWHQQKEWNTCSKGMTGIKTDANAGLVFDTVNDALQFLKTTSHCVALARHVLHHCTGQKFTVNSIWVYILFKGKVPWSHWKFFDIQYQVTRANGFWACDSGYLKCEVCPTVLETLVSVQAWCIFIRASSFIRCSLTTCPVLM